MKSEISIEKLQLALGTKFPNREWVPSQNGWHSIPVSQETIDRRYAYLTKIAEKRRLI